MLTRTFQSDKARRRPPVTVTVDGARLRELRMSMGLSQQQVGDAIGKTKVYVGQIELEKTLPSVAMAVALQEFFGIALHDCGALHIEVKG
jgi:transcriptional regulator with XRE-family HTH domain